MSATDKTKTQVGTSANSKKNEEKIPILLSNGKRNHNTNNNIKDKSSLKIRLSNYDGNSSIYGNDLPGDEELFSDKSYRKIKKVKKSNTSFMMVKVDNERDMKIDEEIFVDDEEEL